MKVLVTGCAGFIGSHICEHLLARGFQVIGIDDLSGGYVRNLPDGISFYEKKIQDPNASWIFEYYKPEYVIHAAAYAAEGLSHYIRMHNYENNVLGSANIINCCVNHGVRRIIFLSSIGIYGYGNPPYHESDRPAPIDPYGIAKYSIEMDLRAAYETWGLEYVICRPHNVYGPRQNLGDPYRNVVGIFMNQCMKHEAMTIFGDGQQRRAFSFIDDVAIPIAHCVDPEIINGTIVNLGGSIVYSVKQLAIAVAQAMNAPCEIKYLPARKEVRDAFCDQFIAEGLFSKILRRVPLEDGLAKMAVWARSMGPQRGEKFGKIDITLGMPPSWIELAKERAEAIV